ncbi:hypothetical protein [Oryzihumus sp.]|jgi:hypothetical protein|uniref:hypothetical protein n=1 Tax=Oryzihumus sp. TaxID=1968903 RepID=UPI002ED9A85A
MSASTVIAVFLIGVFGVATLGIVTGLVVVAVNRLRGRHDEDWQEDPPPGTFRVRPGDWPWGGF